MRPELHHVAVLDRPRLALVRVDHDEPRARLARDGLPLDPGREAGAAVPGEPGRLELFDDALRAAAGSQQLETAARRVVRERLVPLSEPDRRPVVRRMRHRRGRSRRRASAPGRDRSGRGMRPRSPLACSRAARVPRSSRRSARCRREESHPPAPAGTSRTRRPRAPRRAGCSCGRRARPTARG